MRNAKQSIPRRGLLLASAAAAVAPAASVRDRLIGVWHLVSYEMKDKSTGEVTLPYGDKPEGRITYDRAGRMSAQLMRPGRTRLAGNVPQAGAFSILAKASEAELREMVGGFIAYYGTFDVLEGERTIVHHVKGCLLPNWVGTDLRRGYEFEGKRKLTLIADTPRAVGRLVWEREEG
ncbi:MAG: lipocalin-like domain-containing protein [Bryobacteraceae bacterium]